MTLAVAAAAPARWSGLRVVGRRHLGAVDALVAVALAVGGLIEVAGLNYSAPAVLGVVSCLVCTGAVAARRRLPFGAALVSTVGLVVYQVTTKDPDGSFIAPAIVLVYYFVGRSAAERAAWRRLAALLAFGLVADVVIEVGTGPFNLVGALGEWPAMLVPTAAGMLVTRHASLTRRLEAATASLRNEQLVRADRLVGEERNRVARDLHDVVAHHVSVMVIQAGAARLVAARDPVSADAPLRVVEKSGREALADLRRIMGVMRRDDEAVAGESAGLAHLEALADRARASGVAVEIHIEGRLDRVPAAVDLVAYRVVQEALTNVVKHAPHATARVTMHVGSRAVEVTVTDGGAGLTPAGGPPLPGSGHGLIGMRERLALYGGEMSDGFRADGGYELRARIPLRIQPLDLNAESVPPADHTLPRAKTRATRLLAVIKPRSDLMLAAGWLVVLEADVLADAYRRGPLALNVMAVAVMAIAFVWRRRAPLLFVLVVGLAAVPLSSGLTSAHATVVGIYCVTVPMFTVAAWRARPVAVAGLLVWIAGTIGTGVAADKPMAGLAGGLVMSCLLWAAGRLWRQHRSLAERLVETHLLLAAERDDRERLAIAGERARIARELHTLVAHGVVAMIVSATAALTAIREDEESALIAIGSIEETGRQALARMRDILGVLRASRGSPPVLPSPGLGQLHMLIQGLRDGGRTVDLSIEGDPGPVPAVVDLITYRIIEAALAEADPRPSRALTIALRFNDESADVEITGDGLQLAPQVRLAVRERAALCHGAVLPTPTDDRTPRLHVHLPYAVSEAVAL